MTRFGKSEILAKKSLGQHFLKDKNIIERIIALGKFHENDQILEIGPGPGALTNYLKEMPYGKLWLIEKDDAFAREHSLHIAENFQVFHQNALKFPWESLTGDWKIISNLPYNIASPLMWDIVSQTKNLNRAVFMIQKEVAQRILSKPNSKIYGALSVWIQSFCEVEKSFVVPPRFFTPPPKVDSQLIVLKALPEENRPKDPKNLSRLIKICFQQRRKQLHGLLQKALPETYSVACLENIGILPNARAETLSSQDFQKLCAQLFKT